MQNAKTIILVVIISILAFIVLRYVIKTAREYRKDHSCSFCHKFYCSDTWFQVCEQCGNRFCKDKIGYHEDIIETILGVLGETVRVLDRRDRGYRPGGWITVCGYKHIITLHKEDSISLHYCAYHEPGNLGPDALMERYNMARSKRRRSTHAWQVSGWE